jgi:uncharacterized alkaline shock family protein YloU
MDESTQDSGIPAKLGTVQIAPQVLATIARLTTLAVPGVARMHQDPAGNVELWLKRRSGNDGIAIGVVDDAVTVDVHIVAEPQVNLYQLGKTIQNQVSRAVQELVGMPIMAVNVHVEDVESASGEQ